MSRHSVTDRKWKEKIRPAILAACDICWICGHPYADQVDHVLSPRDFPELRFDLANLRPAHGIRGCPICGRKCNQERGDRLEIPKNKHASRWDW